jgi:hypothetical protein
MQRCIFEMKRWVITHESCIHYQIHIFTSRVPKPLDPKRASLRCRVPCSSDSVGHPEAGVRGREIEPRKLALEPFSGELAPHAGGSMTDHSQT